MSVCAYVYGYVCMHYAAQGDFQNEKIRLHNALYKELGVYTES